MGRRTSRSAMLYGSVSARSRHTLLVSTCVLILTLATGCATREYYSRSRSTPATLTSAGSATAAHAEPLPCANGQARNKRGNCPDMPTCPHRCYLGARETDPKSCWNHPDYDKQIVRGVQCAWTFPPGSRVELQAR